MVEVGLQQLNANQDSVQLWSNKILRFSLFLSGYDSLIISKNHHHSDRLTSLREKVTTNSDRQCKVKRRLIVVVVVYSYILIKSIILGALHYMIDYANRHNQKVPVKESSSVLPWTTETLENILDTIGNPLSDLHDIAFISHTVISLTAVCSFYFWPYYFTKMAMDSSYLTLALNPEKEMQHTDLIIKENLDIMLKSVESFKLRIHREYLNWHCMLLTFSEETLDTILENNARQHKLIKRYQQCHSHFRPNTISYHWYRKLSQYYFIAVAVDFIINMLVVFSFMAFITILSTLGKCRKSDKMDCKMFSVLSGLDLLTLAEITTSVSTVFLTYNSLGLILFIQAVHQLKMTQEIKKNLDNCLNWLRYLNRSQESFTNGESQELLIDSILIETLVKIRIFESDTKRAVNFISKIMFLLLHSCALSTLLVLVSATMNLSLGINIGIPLVVSAWLSTNALISICAYLLTQYIAMIRIGWSIVAEISLRKSHFVSTGPDDFVSIQWRKQVLNNYDVEENHSVRPLNTSLTFKRALQVNLFITTLMSVLYSRK